MYSLLTIIVFFCGHTNDNVVYETDWLHIPSKMTIIIIVIILFINCSWILIPWQWLFYMYTNMEKKK